MEPGRGGRVSMESERGSNQHGIREGVESAWNQRGGRVSIEPGRGVESAWRQGEGSNQHGGRERGRISIEPGRGVESAWSQRGGRVSIARERGSNQHGIRERVESAWGVWGR
ncbi:hypothetical protein Pcinc_018375 [Petrolisthes cinctipes]|uniref:Uncharacterized protein n=1 Tax=Petrolisthes cinctipes TaxID=88211 RepID=A0AAE1KMT8_PETCI|nr:hypothetical protein Pcinc_018375 [Petrolisthes cinctipes]